MATLEKTRAEVAAAAMWRLKHEVIPSLELVIAGTPTGPARDKLTDANIILHLIADPPKS